MVKAMINDTDDVLGHAVFGTFRGLAAYGTGILANIQQSTSVLEFRNTRQGSAIPEEGDSAIFRRVVYVDGYGSIQLIGIMRFRWDDTHRAGFIGVCVAVPLTTAHNLGDRITDCYQLLDRIETSEWSEIKQALFEKYPETPRGALSVPVTGEVRLESERRLLLCNEASTEKTHSDAFVGFVFRLIAAVKEYKNSDIILHECEKKGARPVSLNFLHELEDMRERDIANIENEYHQDYQQMLNEGYQEFQRKRRELEERIRELESALRERHIPDRGSRRYDSPFREVPKERTKQSVHSLRAQLEEEYKQDSFFTRWFDADVVLYVVIAVCAIVILVIAGVILYDVLL